MVPNGTGQSLLFCKSESPRQHANCERILYPRPKMLSVLSSPGSSQETRAGLPACISLEPSVPRVVDNIVFSHPRSRISRIYYSNEYWILFCVRDVADSFLKLASSSRRAVAVQR